jgi:hypothetical protein
MVGGLSGILRLASFKPYSLDMGLSPAEMPQGGITAQVCRPERRLRQTHPCPDPANRM